MGEEPKLSEDLDARLAAGKAKTETQLLAAVKGSGPWVDVSIVALFLFMPVIFRMFSGATPGLDSPAAAQKILLLLFVVFHFRTRHRIDSLLELIERKGLLRPK